MRDRLSIKLTKNRPIKNDTEFSYEGRDEETSCVGQRRPIYGIDMNVFSFIRIKLAFMLKAVAF